MEELVAAEADAWNKGDAHAFSTRCTEDISFTNIIGTSYYGLAAFEERSIKRLCFIRADVATADVNTELRSYAKLPSGIQTGDDGVLRTRLLFSRRAITCSRATIREAALPRHGTKTASNSEVAFCVPFGTEGATDAAHAALRRTALMHCRKQLRESEECFLLSADTD